jgi:Undecaprenyl-phosphate glucose phosphotransferase
MSVLNSNGATPHIAPADRDRIRLRYEYVPYVAFLSDAIMIISASVSSGILYHTVFFSKYGNIHQYISLGFLISLIAIFANHARDAYSGQKLLDLYFQLKVSSFSIIIAFIAIVSVSFSFKVSNLISRGYVVTFFVSAIILIVASRAIWAYFLRASLERGLFVRRRMLAICECDSDLEGPTITELRRYGYSPVSAINIPQGDISSEAVRNLIRQVATTSQNLSVDEIVITVSIHRLNIVTRLVEELRTLPIPVRFAFDGASAEVISRPSYRLGGILSFQVQRSPLGLLESIVKRSFDITIASVALLVLSPTMLLTAIAIKLTSPGPVLFKQMRFGMNGKQFQILKFRSMFVISKDADFRQASRFDARVTRVGKIIRRSSIDELPQLWNVLRGEMSIVGPRPHAVAHDEAYQDLIQRFSMRRFVKPGLTGWAQVNGSRGETPTIESMRQRVQYDLWYIDNWSIWLDMSIVLRTFLMLFNPKDVY